MPAACKALTPGHDASCRPASTSPLRGGRGHTGCPSQVFFEGSCQTLMQVKVNFPRKGSSATPPHPSGDFKWKDYCPKVFKRLRDVFNINPAQYMLSICGTAPRLPA